jgi:hypothetical protein
MHRHIYICIYIYTCIDIHIYIYIYTYTLGGECKSGLSATVRLLVTGTGGPGADGDKDTVCVYIGMYIFKLLDNYRDANIP